MKGESRAPAY